MLKHAGFRRFCKQISECIPLHPISVDDLQQFRLQYKFALLVLLSRLISLIIFPPHGLVALSAYNVPHHMSPRGHVPFHGFGGFDVDDAGEEEGFAG